MTRACKITRKKVLLIGGLVWAVVSLSVPALAAAPVSQDAAIVQAVHHRFQSAEGIPGPLITIGATNGVVTLSGEVRNLLARNRAAQVAATVPGVSAVSNNLVMLPTDRSAWALRSGVAAALANAPALNADKINPKVEDGFVTLEGTVRSWPERRLAELLAEGVNGVPGVDNKLRVDYGVARSDAEIKEDILSQLKWDPWLDSPERLQVLVAGASVRVTGLVDNPTARRHVYQDGWVSGVNAVDISGVQVVPDVRLAWSASGVTDSSGVAGPGSLTDAQVQKAVVGACGLDPLLQPGHIEVQVQNGFVILRGEVPSADGKHAAGEIAREVAGTGQVENLLTVWPSPGSP